MGNRKYTAEFKRSAVGLVKEQKYSRQEAAKNLGIGVSTLDAWRHKQRHLNGAADLVEEKDLRRQIARLQQENRRLTMERDISKAHQGMGRNQRPVCFGGRVTGGTHLKFSISLLDSGWQYSMMFGPPPEASEIFSSGYGCINSRSPACGFVVCV